jgi:hypothetical protein
MNTIQSFMPHLFISFYRRLFAVRCDGGEGQQPRTKIQKAIAKMARNVKHPEKYQDPDIPEVETIIRRKP